MTEIPSLIVLALSSLCKRLPPEDRPMMYQRLNEMFDEHSYSEVFRTFDAMDYCLHCDMWVSPFNEIMRKMPSREPYHLLVSHPDLRYRKDCDCQVCDEYNQSHVYSDIHPIGKARLTLCVNVNSRIIKHIPITMDLDVLLFHSCLHRNLFIS